MCSAYIAFAVMARWVPYSWANGRDARVPSSQRCLFQLTAPALRPLPHGVMLVGVPAVALYRRLQGQLCHLRLSVHWLHIVQITPPYVLIPLLSEVTRHTTPPSPLFICCTHLHPPWYHFSLLPTPHLLVTIFLLATGGCQFSFQHSFSPTSTRSLSSASPLSTVVTWFVNHFSLYPRDAS